MKITRVTTIRGHGIFRDFSWPRDLHAFGRFNLIYGWNASGKTTLSSLFALLEKRTNLSDGEVEFEIDGDRRCSGADIATSNPPSVRVFNRDFINSAVLTAGEPVRPVYYLGEQSIDKQKKVAEFRKQIVGLRKKREEETSRMDTASRDFDTFCVNQARSIKRLLVGSHTSQYNNYDKRWFRDSSEAIDTGVAKEHSLSTAEYERLRQKKDSQPKDRLETIALNVPDFARTRHDADELLQRTVVSDTLEELLQDNEVARWLQQGLALHSGQRNIGKCRFCGQQFSSERRAALEAHFNAALTRFQEDIGKKVADLETGAGDLKKAQFPDPARVYDHLQADLSEAIDSAKTRIESALAWLASVRQALEARKAAPLDTTGLPKLAEILAAPDRAALEAAIGAVNFVLDKHNAVTNEFQAEVTAAAEQLERFHVAEAWPEYSSKKKAISDAESALDPLRAAISRLNSQVEEIEREIVEHRRPADELNAELRAYLGRDDLRFEISGTGYTLTRSGTPVSNLSEGERTAIAFLYFLKTLQDKSFDLASGVVVIDDPVSSLDANSLFFAFGFMKERTKDCGQLFVLTHNFGFFRQVKNWFHHIPKQRSTQLEVRPARFFLLAANADDKGCRNALLGPIDPLLEKYESEYHYLFRRVYDEAKAQRPPPSLESSYGMPNIARRLLEAFLAFRYPDCSTLLERLERAQTHLDPAKKTRVLRSLHTYSHADAIAEPEHDLSVLAETRSVLNDVLELIEQLDPKHYDGMRRLVTESDGAG